jgi:ligand-binding SRPBCC domain-containing protein
MRIYIATEVEENYKAVFSRFDKELFLALKPPLIQLNLTRFDGCLVGDKVELTLGMLGIHQLWTALIVDQKETAEEIYFVDEGQQIPPPIKKWRHRHVIKKLAERKTLIVDDIEFSTGYKLLDVLMYPIMYLQFWYRKPVYKRYFSKT